MKLRKLIKKISADHVSAYAAQSAFFMMLSMIPIILLLLTLIRYTPITQSDIMKAVYEVFPKTIRTTMVAIVSEVYSHNITTISLAFVMTIWSAGKGVMAISRGLNAIHKLDETRNYFFLRIRAAFYTILFIVAIVCTLVLLGFGNGISLMLYRYIPAFRYVIEIIIRVRVFISIGLLTVITICIFEFLPNQRRGIKKQIPGAVFTALGWTFISFLFSIYMDVFKGFSNMYGSLTTIVLIMLWLYFCMYIMLLGGEINEIYE